MHKSEAKLSPEELEEVMKLHREANATPVIAFGSAHAMAGGASADARRRVIRRIDELATSYGLKPQDGEWGIDLDGHFLSQYPIAATEPADA